MIFLTVGTQLPFDRLVRAVDAWAGHHPDVPVVAQIGATNFAPQNMEHHVSLLPDDYNALCRDARLMIAHAGTGSFIKAQILGKPILAMARQSALGEHRNDHQVATAAHFAARDGIHIVQNADAVGPTIDQLLTSAQSRVSLSAFADQSLLSAVRAVVFSDS